MKRDWLWDRDLDEKEIEKIFSDKDNPKFISLAAVLLSRKNSAQEVFKDYLRREDFYIFWSKIKKQMRKNSWNDPRIEYWQAIYDTLKKVPDLADLKQVEFEKPLFALCKEIGLKIKKMREKSGLTQKKLADKLGISQQIISRIEKGKQNISLETLNNICGSLGTPLNAEKFGFKNTEKPDVTSTKHILPFLNLSPYDFSRMCLWIVRRSPEFDKAESYDGPGDKGRDVVGYKYNKVGKREKWYFQCKRYDRISFKDFKKEIDKFKKHSDKEKDFRPDVIVFVTGCRISPPCKDKTKKYAKEQSFESIEIWDEIQLDEKAKATKGVMEEFFDNKKGISKADLEDISKENIEETKLNNANQADRIINQFNNFLQQSNLIANSDPAKTDKINKDIDTAVKFIHGHDFEEAKSWLNFVLGKIIDNPTQYTTELARVYTNLSVCFHRPKIEGGDIDQAKKYIDLALNADPDFDKAKINLASIYLSKGGKINYKKAHDLSHQLWDESDKKDPFLLRVYLWSIYHHKSPEKAIDYYENSEEANLLISQNEELLNLAGVIYLNVKDLKKAKELIESALEISPNSLQSLMFKAMVLMACAQKDNIIPDVFEIVTKFRDYQYIEEAERLLDQAYEIAKEGNNNYLREQIIIHMCTCLLWLRRTNQAKYKQFRKLIHIERLPLQQQQLLRIQDFGAILEERNFEGAYNLLVQSPEWNKIDYEEKNRIAHIYYLRGAPEQSKNILKQLENDAEQKKDIQFWLDMSLNEVLLDNKNMAIKAVQKAKNFSIGTNQEQEVLSHFNTLMLRYAYSGETDRLMGGLFEHNKKYPDDRVIHPIKAIDEQGKPTEEIRSILLKQREWYKKVIKKFRADPRIISYFLEEIFNKTYAEILSLQNDPEFIFEFTNPDERFQKEIIDNLFQAEYIIFDYASLLNLSKMNLLGHLEKLGKQLYIAEKLFNKVQYELLIFEQEDLRRLWNFLRTSKEINIIEEAKGEMANYKINNVFDPWIIESIKLAKAKNAVFITDDLRFARFLRSENIKGSNSLIILKDMLARQWIDSKIYSLSIGDLAERCYTFLSYTGEDLFQIVIEDHSKITLRSYHLVNQLFLPGSIVSSFIPVFVKFIDLLWMTGSLPEDKVQWLKFLTDTILKFVYEQCEIENNKELESIVPHFAQMWIIAIQRSNRDTIILLEKETAKILDKSYLVGFKENITKFIAAKKESLGLK